MLPSPTTVINTFAYKIKGGTVPDGSSLATHIMSSLKIALGGFCAGSIIGVPMGIGMAWNDKLNKFVKPLFDLLRPCLLYTSVQYQYFRHEPNHYGR